MDIGVFHLPTGTYETRAAMAVRGGSFRDRRAFAASAILVRHPQGDLLIDAGFGAGLARHLAMLPWYQRSPHRAGRTAAAQLDAAGYDRGRLRGVVLTHTHWDHASGLDGFEDTPVWLNGAERRYAAGAPDSAVFRHVSARHEIRAYGFGSGPYQGFPDSHDVHGDGSVVIVLAAGHTAGSVIVFVTDSAGRRYAFIGDLTWQLDGLHRRAERPWLMRRFADHDPATVRTGLLRMAGLGDGLQVVPAHDLRAYQGIPGL
ncbi:MBL fold metallo-hydrolase [Catenuloplanes japonicus]|uniref:MBL fold metallo-hydrolase n=1 Tax=Catenuloplanes japonicus TaxID=33876 RepID=UPI000527D069|nr:MBL fold metallo-hydrolase [Catenuloplanes japonicus]